MEEIELQDDDLEFVKQFDIIYAERWAKSRQIYKRDQAGRADMGYMIFLNVWNRKVTTRSFRILIMHLSYDRDDEYIRKFHGEDERKRGENSRCHARRIRKPCL